MSDENQPPKAPAPMKKTSAVSLKKETVRVTLKPDQAPGGAPTPPAAGAPAPPESTIPLETAGAPAAPPAPPAPTIPLKTAGAPTAPSAPAPAPTIALKSAPAPTAPGGPSTPSWPTPPASSRPSASCPRSFRKCSRRSREHPRRWAGGASCTDTRTRPRCRASWRCRRGETCRSVVRRKGRSAGCAEQSGRVAAHGLGTNNSASFRAKGQEIADTSAGVFFHMPALKPGVESKRRLARDHS